MPPVLEINRLGMRFGGIHALKDFSLSVNQREIVSVIGPNGAGKTTVFNAITGIFPPTTGSIRFGGRSIERPFTWQVVAGCFLVGVISAIMFALLMANPDLLWYAAVRRPHNIGQASRGASPPVSPRFSLSQSLGLAADYFRGRLAMEPARRKWKITSADGSITLHTVRTENEARTMLGWLQEQGFPSSPSDPEFTSRDNRFVFSQFAEAGFKPVFTAAEKTEFLSQLAVIRTRNARLQQFTLLGLLGGFCLGTAGNYAIWSRSRRTPDVISRGGIARTFQNIRLFHNMTVLENVLVGLDRNSSFSLQNTLRHWCGWNRAERERVAQARELLSFMGLDEQRTSLARNLPYGDQRRLEIARAMATRPQLLLLDEPAAGMNPSESEELMHLIRQIRDRGITILLIEHHMKLVMGISDRVAVLEYGEGIAEGTPAEVRSNPRVIEAYLGKEEVT